jgi:hypothetical protein
MEGKRKVVGKSMTHKALVVKNTLIVWSFGQFFICPVQDTKMLSTSNGTSYMYN